MTKERLLMFLKYTLLFILLYMFFTELCPIIPYEGDDWYFIGAMRQPIPYFGIFNPSKVLPEILEPLCGYIGAFLIYPFTHDYIGSLSASCTGCVSLFIVLMVYLFNRVLTKRYKFSQKKAFLYEFLFLILFFVFFKKENQISFYGFWSKSLNCYFNYLIPALINACTVLFMMGYENFQESFNKMNYYKKGLFIVLIYFTIFSSIQLNIIVSSYSFICLLNVLLKNIKGNIKFKIKLINILKSSWIYILILLTWLLSIYYDLSGMRGKMVTNSGWLNYSNFIDTIRTLFRTYKLVYAPLVWITILGIILIVIYSIKNRNRIKEILKFYVYITLILVLNISYLVLLYMQAGWGYATRIDATWGILFYLILLIMMVIIMCNKYIKFTEIGVPIMIVLFSLVALNQNYRFAQSIYDGTSAKDVGNYIINQIIEADKSGKSSAHVKVPKHEDFDSNWPHPYNMAMWLQNTLYAHKITRNRMYITFTPDEKVTKELYNKDYSNMFFFDFERSMFLK